MSVRVYANDSSNNWAVSAQYGFTLTPNTADTTPPAFGSITANTAVAGSPVQLDCPVSDNVAVSSYLYSWNNTGSWVNQTVVAVSGSSVTTSFAGTWNSVAGSVVSVRVYANDSSNNWAVSAQYGFTLTPNTADTTPPAFGSITANTAVAGSPVQLRLPSIRQRCRFKLPLFVEQHG